MLLLYYLLLFGNRYVSFSRRTQETFHVYLSNSDLQAPNKYNNHHLTKVIWVSWDFIIILFSSPCPALLACCPQPAFLWRFLPHVLQFSYFLLFLTMCTGTSSVPYSYLKIKYCSSVVTTSYVCWSHLSRIPFCPWSQMPCSSSFLLYQACSAPPGNPVLMVGSPIALLSITATTPPPEYQCPMILFHRFLHHFPAGDYQLHPHFFHRVCLFHVYYISRALYWIICLVVLPPICFVFTALL